MKRSMSRLREHAIELHKLGLLTRKEIAAELDADYSTICKHLRKADRGHWGKKRSSLMKFRSYLNPYERSVYPALAMPYKRPRDRKVHA